VFPHSLAWVAATCLPSRDAGSTDSKRPRQVGLRQTGLLTNELSSHWRGKLPVNPSLCEQIMKF
jgi:hypothetical protein